MAASPSAEAGAAIPDEYIVVFQDNVADPPGLARQLAAAHGASVRFTYTRALKGFAAHMSAAAAQALQNNPNVSFVEQDQTVAAIGSENLPGGDPWGLDRIDQASLPLNSTYSYTDTGLGVVAYIIDTGIRTTHSEFGGRASGGFTAIADGNDTNDCNGHGTHVSGTVGGSTYGVAKAVTLVAVRVLDCSGSGSTAGVIAGIDWVTANHATPAVANMSLGGGASSSLDLAVNNSITAGVGYAIAAGNGNQAGIAQNACNYSPARVGAAMTIGATTKTDAKTSWSNYGSCVDWFAPGNGIKSAWNTDDNATNTISGTSMATPHVTGVAALYLQSHHSATPQQLRDALYAATLKGVVTSSNTANNHLLYSPPSGFGGGSPPPNAPPTAAFTQNCTNLSCQFTDQSNDDVGIASRSWDFGDGGTSTAQSPSHAYAAAGTFTVSLTVMDGGGLQGTTFHSVTVQAPPPPPAATLTGSGSKSKGTWSTSITWSGFPGTVTSVDVYRNGTKVATRSVSPNSYGDSGKGGGTFIYKVCQASSATVCTNEVTITP
jgi:subtilisin family serine protease